MIRKLSEREHLLQRPAMYIGAVDLTKSNEYIFENDTVNYKEVQYVPGLIKIINEIIDNSVDVAIKTNFKSSNEISIKITNKTVEVKDNGTGIPVLKNEDGHYLPELCWNHARAGSNFEDDKNRTQLGMNGIGSYATACFSKKFVGETDDGKLSYKITITDNAEKFTESTSASSKQTGTKVIFEPDFERFNVTEIDEVHMNIIKQRLINLSMSFPEITFKFNSKKINVNSFKKYVSLFNDVSEIYETEDYKFAILPNEADDFRHFSYVNGLKIPDGGTHIDIIINNVVNNLKDKLTKKYKQIKPGDIRNKLMVIAFLKNVKNTKFNSQSKEKITNSNAEINEYYGNIDFEKISNKIFKTAAIIEPITEVYKLKEELKKRQELKGLNKTVKKIKSDKYYPSIGVKKYLFLVEGQCLEENTEVLMADFTSKKIKDLNVNDKIISSDMSIQTVSSKAKLLKETITFSTCVGEITCGQKHKFKVYDTELKVFDFVEAIEIKKDINRYKFLKSKINDSSRYIKIDKNENHILTANDEFISYTDDDYFVIIRDFLIMRVHALDIKTNDLIVLSEG